MSKLDNDTTSGSVAPGQWRLPRAAPAASAYRPGLRPGHMGTCEITTEDLTAAGGEPHAFTALKPLAGLPEPQPGQQEAAANNSGAHQSSGRVPAHRSAEGTPRKGGIPQLFQRRQSPMQGTPDECMIVGKGPDQGSAEPAGDGDSIDRSARVDLGGHIACSSPVEHKAPEMLVAPGSMMGARSDPESISGAIIAMPGGPAGRSGRDDGSNASLASPAAPGIAPEPLRNEPASPDCVYSGMRLELNLDSGDEMEHDGGLSPLLAASDDESWHASEQPGACIEPAIPAQLAARQADAEFQPLRSSQVGVHMFLNTRVEKMPI